MTITLSLNNISTTVGADTSLIDALHIWGYGEGKIAVAINGEFVPRSAYAQRILQADDEIDIVQPVGGG